MAHTPTYTARTTNVLTNTLIALTDVTTEGRGMQMHRSRTAIPYVAQNDAYVLTAIGLETTITSKKARKPVTWGLQCLSRLTSHPPRRRNEIAIGMPRGWEGRPYSKKR